MRTRDLVKKADSYFDQGRYTKALALYNQAIEQSENDSELYQHKGEVLAQMGRYEEAIKSYNKAIKLNPNEWWYHLWKGDAFAFLRNPTKAIAAYRRANALNPMSSAVLYSMAISYAQLGRKRAACRSLKVYLGIKPDQREKVAQDRHFKTLRNEPEFQAILGKRRTRSE